MDKFISAFKDRLNNPFMVSIVISWFLWNYEFIIVCLSSEAAMAKIQLINNQIYYSASMKFSCWVLLPLASASLYTFGYPFVDIKISAFLEGLKVKRERRLLEVSRTMPIASELQYDYFVEQDKEIESYKKRLDKVIESTGAELRKLKEQNKRMTDKYSRQVLNLFCSGTNLTPHNLWLMLDQDMGTFSESVREPINLYKELAQKKEFPWLLKLAKESQHREISIDDRKLISAEHITDTALGISEAERIDYLDLVIALGLVTVFYNEYSVEPVQMNGIMNIAEHVARAAAAT